MTEEKPGLTKYEIKGIIGLYTVLTSAQRELLNAAFEIREGMSFDEAKEMVKYLVLAKVVPKSTLESILKRLYP